RYSRIYTDGKGQWILAWFSTEASDATLGDDFDILISRSHDNGANWSAPVWLNTNAAVDSGSDINIRLATDERDNWIAVWSSSEPTLGGGEGGVFGEYDILTARSSDNGLTWSTPADLNTNAMTDKGYDMNPRIT